MTPRVRLPLPLLLISVVAAACGGERTESPSVTGLIDAAELDVASKVPGRIKELYVREGDRVEAGQAIAAIESDELEARRAQARAAISAVDARLRLARGGARSEDRRAAQSQLDAARHQLDLAQKMFDRMTQLRASNSIPLATFDEAESRLNLARDGLAVAQTRWDLAVKGARPEEIDALQAQLRQAEGALAEVESYRKETTQKAPLGAQVSSVVLRKGELATTGTPIVTLVDLDDVWATFPVREDNLRAVKQGSMINVRIPALDQVVPMEVFALSAMGDFATWKATTEKKGFDLKTFEVKARPKARVDGLRPGMTAHWSITDAAEAR